MPSKQSYAVWVLMVDLNSVDDILLPGSLCSKPFKVEIMRVELKEWKTRGHDNMKTEKACIYLGIATNSGPLRGGSGKPLVHNNDTTQGQSVNINLDNLPGSTAEVSQPRATSLARLAFGSPWPLIVIELLTGESVDPNREWIPPFKHFVMYEKQIRMFVQLLGEKNADFLEAKDLIRTLKEITEEVVRNLDPTRGDFAYSEATINSMLDKRESFVTHFKKARHGLAEHQDSKEELNGDAEEGTGERAEATVVQSEGVEENLKISSSAAVFEGTTSRSPNRQTCSCLRDAKHHLQLLLTVLDENLGDLLILRKAISEKSLKKIEFEHLWHLFQPGILVVTAKSPRQAYRVLHVSGGRSLMTTQPLLDRGSPVDQQDTSRKSKRSPFRLDCIKYDFDGEVFGPLQETLSLVEYNDEKKITELDVYPMEFSEDQTALNRVLIERGRQFAGFHKFKHKRYAGLSLQDPQEEVIQFNYLALTSALTLSPRKDRKRSNYRFHASIPTSRVCEKVQTPNRPPGMQYRRCQRVLGRSLLP